ncbi:MAG: hypothetical protein WA063_03290 [Minisyncoccia bacterium]
MDVIELRKALEKRKRKKEKAKSGEKTTKPKCSGRNGQCKNCAPIIPAESLVKTIEEENADGGYCGGGSRCEGKKSCMACKDKPQFAGIDYRRY